MIAGRVLHVEGHEGKAVALDPLSGEVVAFADTPQELVRIVRERGLVSVTIVGVPEFDEPLRVGLG